VGYGGWVGGSRCGLWVWWVFDWILVWLTYGLHGGFWLIWVAGL